MFQVEFVDVGPYNFHSAKTFVRFNFFFKMKVTLSIM
jgi:hypothetical protein